jgi:hypothetical protein
MFRSAATRQSDLATHRLSVHLDGLTRTARSWFDATPESVDARIAKLDQTIALAQDTAARLGSTPAGIRATAVLPDLEHSRRELAAARDSLLNGFSDRQAGYASAGRRTANDLRDSLASPDEDDDEPAFRPGHEPDYAGQAKDLARQQQMEQVNREWQDNVRGKERDQYGDIIGSRTGNAGSWYDQAEQAAMNEEYDSAAEDELHRRHRERGGEGNPDPRGQLRRAPRAWQVRPARVPARRQHPEPHRAGPGRHADRPPGQPTGHRLQHRPGSPI